MECETLCFGHGYISSLVYAYKCDPRRNSSILTYGEYAVRTVKAGFNPITSAKGRERKNTSNNIRVQGNFLQGGSLSATCKRLSDDSKCRARLILRACRLVDWSDGAMMAILFMAQHLCGPFRAVLRFTALDPVIVLALSRSLQSYVVNWFSFVLHIASNGGQFCSLTGRRQTALSYFSLCR